MKRFTKFAFIAATALALASACSKDDGSSSNKKYNEEDLVFVIATQTTSATTGSTVAVLLTNETLDSGSITTVKNGTEVETIAGEWAFSPYKDYCYSIKDSGGTSTVAAAQYYVDAADGRMKIGNQYVGDAYHTWGMWDDTFVTTRHGGSYTESAKSVTITNPDAMTVGETPEVTYYGVYAGTCYYSPSIPTTELGSFGTDNYIGKYASEYSNGETAAITGFVTSGDYVYASLATTGVSTFAVNTPGYGWDTANDGHIAIGYGSYKNETLESTTYFTPTGGVPMPLTPGNAYVARYSLSGSFQSTPTIIATDQMGQAFSRTTGNPLRTIIDNEDDGYVYVFSPGTTRRYRNDANTDGVAENEAFQYLKGESTTVDKVTTQTNYSERTTNLKIATTDHGAKVMRIKSGEAAFDSSFGTKDFSTMMGDYTFSRVWHISGSKFLLRVIHTENLYNASHKDDVGDAHFYIYDSSANTATKVSGLPDPNPDNDDDTTADSAFYEMGSSAIGEPCFVGTKAYIPMATNDGSNPAIWIVDSSTATATKGLEVVCTVISAVSQMVAQ